MSKLTFNSNDRPTVGIELELGLVDGRTMELSSSIGAVLAERMLIATAPVVPRALHSWRIACCGASTLSPKRVIRRYIHAIHFFGLVM